MENLLLRYLRQQAGYSVEQMADVLRITVTAYDALEQGHEYLDLALADKAGILLKIDSTVLYGTSLQLEMIHTGQELIKRQEWTIEMLMKLVKHLKPSRKRQ